LVVTRAGRPRSPRADQAILEAATDVFIDRGWDGLRVEDVAIRACVGKTTIYRRYPSKLDLLLAAAEQLCAEKGPVPDTGSLRGDLSAYATTYLRMVTTTRTGRAIPEMVAAMARHPELTAPYRQFFAERRASWLVLIDRGVVRGELPAEVDREQLVDLIVGPLFYRAFVTHRDADPDYVDRLVDTALAAVA
jgi:AcrR family transcriptional regulator